MDPGTFEIEYLTELVNIGFNRVSLGVQSFDDEILESLGRVHRSIDVYKAIQMLKDVGLNNFSIDLISGVPGLTLAKWAETLEIAVSLKPSHMSVYDLQIEENTPFHKWFGDEEYEESNDHISKDSSFSKLPKSLRKLPSGEDSAFMYKYASGYLKAAGFDHYEISSYSKPGFRSKHNSLYWEVGANWLGKYIASNDEFIFFLI